MLKNEANAATRNSQPQKRTLLLREHTCRVFSLFPTTGHTASAWAFCVGRNSPVRRAPRPPKIFSTNAFAYISSSRYALFYRCVLVTTCCSNGLKNSGHDKVVDQILVPLEAREKYSKMYGLRYTPSRVDWARNTRVGLVQSKFIAVFYTKKTNCLPPYVEPQQSCGNKS